MVDSCFDFYLWRATTLILMNSFPHFRSASMNFVGLLNELANVD